MTDIEKLKELEAKATRGRWKVFATEREFVGGHTRQVYQIRTEKRHPQLKDHYPVVCECEQNLKDGQKHGIWLSKEDAAFIVAMRNALPALLASLASKEGECEGLRASLALRDATIEQQIPRERELRMAAESRLTTALAALERLASAKLLSQIRPLVAGWNGENLPPEKRYGRHHAELGVTLRTNTGEVYAIDEAIVEARATLAKLNEIEGNEDEPR